MRLRRPSPGNPPEPDARATGTATPPRVDLLPDAGTAPAPAAPRFAALDGLRAVGALAVLSTHVGFQTGTGIVGPAAPLLARLDVGVAVFFVVSGFLLHRPRVAAALGGSPAPRLGRYLRHRALRILPAYWLAVLAAATLMPTNASVPRDTWVRMLTLTQTYVSGPPPFGLTQMWSLAVEVAFYLVLPPLAALLLLRRAGRTTSVRTQLVALGVVALVGPVWSWATHRFDQPLAALWLPGYLSWFAAGMLLATWHAGRQAGALRRSVVDDLAALPGTSWLMALAAFGVAATPVAGPYDLRLSSAGEAVAKALLYTVVAGLVVLPAVAVGDGEHAGWPARALCTPPARWLGDVSYGVFCYHVVLLDLVRRWLGHELFSGGFLRVWTATALASVAVAGISWVYVERPLLRWRPSRAPRTARTTTGATTASASGSATSS